MSQASRKIAAFLGGFLYVLLGFSPVWADDTEIYFGNLGSAGGKANVLFVIDTSGSMDTRDGGKSTSRLDDLKQAFSTLLGEVTNVNVGLMRFSDPGGPILYPIAGINQELVDGSGAPRTVTAAVKSSVDDGYQYKTSGTVMLNSTGLEMGAAAPYYGVNILSTSAAIASSANDAGTVGSTTSTSDTYLYAPTKNGSNSIAGLRFTDVTIPSNAVITRAYLSMEVGPVGTDADSNPWQLAIYGEKADVGVFGTSSTSTPSSRIGNTGNLTGASTPVVWSIDKSSMPATDNVIRSPDIASLIQPMLSSWSSGKGAVTLLFKKSATSTSANWISFSSYDRYKSATKNIPKLVIEYYVSSTPPTPAAVMTALRFTNVVVPKGAKIINAKISFTALASDAAPANLSIYGEKTGSSAALTTAANNITGRTKTSALVHWDNMDPWIAGESYDTPDLKTVVQEMVNYDGTSDLPGWCGGSDMTFLIDGSVGRRLAAAYDDGSVVPTLLVEYDPTSVVDGKSCVRRTSVNQISAGSDDAEQFDDTTVTSNSPLNLVARTIDKKRYAQKVGLRFTNVQIPKDSVILDAYLQFVGGGSDTKAVSSGLTIKGESNSNPATFKTSRNNISDRKTTTASVNWSATSSPALGDWATSGTYTSPDLTTIVQELVKAGDWESGKNMALIISGSDSTNMRRAIGYEGGVANAAKLIITYRDTSVNKLTVRDTLLNTVNDLSAGGWTPIQDTMYEAALYFLGENVLYGAKRGDGYNYTRVSHADSMVSGTYTINRPTGCTEGNLDAKACKGETITPVAARGVSGGARYKTPVTASCQINHLILLTDGEANKGHSSKLIQNLVGAKTCDRASDADEACMKDLAAWMLNDNIPIAGTSGKTKVITNTIAFYLSDANGNPVDKTAQAAISLLTDVASAGGGKFYQASEVGQLATALKEILVGVQQTNTSFVSAGTAVNAFNRTLNRDELYFSVFQPQSGPHWPGNLKKYKLAPPPSTDILDFNNKNAVDENGFFSEDAQSFWSASKDGADVKSGGAGALITDYEHRNLYTYLDNLDAPNKNLTVAVNAISPDNKDLTAEVMGVSAEVPAYTAQQLADLIDWTRGKDVPNSTTRYVFADPLHSRPVAVTYGGSEENPDITVFVSTNSGFLHAINNSSGAEQFAFIPRELLPLQQKLRANVTTDPHPYGLDGSITVWVVDPDDDGVVLGKDNQLQANNAVYLYQGMRRGGRNYYALDVTNRSAPKILWTIKGGVDTGFNKLGQTWAQPLKARVQINSAVHNVLIFSGGYDENQDVSKARDDHASDSMGNAVYIVDAVSGELLWSGSNETGASKVFSDMKYSIPSSITGADINGDGLMDLLFVGDTGGQVWRFDIHNGSGATDLVTGGVIADLNAAGDPATAVNNRRFYHSPAMFIGLNGKRPYLGVTLGSGWRAHPLNKDTGDQFYMIRQYDIFSAPETYTKLTLANLYNATSNAIGDADADTMSEAKQALAQADGWYINMINEGEKVLSTPLIVEGQVFFNTYQPGTPDVVDPCQPATGINRSYTMSAFDATPTIENNGLPGLQAEDRSKIINAVGIIDQQRQLIRKGDDGQLISVGLEGTATKNLPSDFFKKVHRIYWYENR